MESHKDKISVIISPISTSMADGMNRLFIQKSILWNTCSNCWALKSWYDSTSLWCDVNKLLSGTEYDFLLVPQCVYSKDHLVKRELYPCVTERMKFSPVVEKYQFENFLILWRLLLAVLRYIYVAGMYILIDVNIVMSSVYIANVCIYRHSHILWE